MESIIYIIGFKIVVKLFSKQSLEIITNKSRNSKLEKFIAFG